MFRGGARDRWFDHRDVVVIADEVARIRETELVKFVRLAMRTDHRATVDAKFTLLLARHPGIVAAARAVADAGYRIATSPNARSLRGAVVTRMTWELIRGRAPMAGTEVQIELDIARGRWSRPKDVVVDDDITEVYECKNDPGWLDQPDVDELAEIRDACTAAGRDPRVGIVALSSPTAIQESLRALTLSRPLYWASQRTSSPWAMARHTAARICTTRPDNPQRRPRDMLGPAPAPRVDDDPGQGRPARATASGAPGAT